MIKAILYDLDGVLVDACELHYKALNEALREIAHFEISRNDHEMRFNGLPTKEKLRILTADGRLHPTLHERINTLKQQKTFDLIRDTIKRDEIKIKLHRWASANWLLIGCVTNCSWPTAQLMLEKSGQFDFLNVMISNEDVMYPKPSPEGYLKALVNLGLKEHQVLCVEDSDKGVAAITALGAPLLRVSNPSEVTVENVSAALKRVADMSGSKR